MIPKEELTALTALQRQELHERSAGIPREIKLDVSGSHALILKGVRRCGKSTLLRQLTKRLGQFAYFNFDDPRAVGFEGKDFERLSEIFQEKWNAGIYCFDEIQLIPGWERYIRLFLDQQKKCVVTGSNASLLGVELGTHLTGRHLDSELYPFSYKEYLAFTGRKPSKDSLLLYLEEGGFPEYLASKKAEVLQLLLKDILSRDIVVRYGLKDGEALQKIAGYLLTNAGKEFSYNKLKVIAQVSSVNTVASFVHYLEDSYLLFVLQQYSRSQKQQLVRPKKCYPIDTGFARANSVTFSEDLGRKLETAVFLHLKRKKGKIYYFREHNECDFLVQEGYKISQAIQVCTTLSGESTDREIKGLEEAMKECKLNGGLIVTLDSRDTFHGIEAVPAWKWLLE